jgi:molecular chaperone GrpE
MADEVKHEAPALKVVDRRWWAREPAAGEDAGQAPSLKPTYVEELEQRLAAKDRDLQTLIAKYKEAANDFEQARARLRREVMKDAERSRRAMLAEFLEVVDNLDRALAAASQTQAAAALIEGVEMVRRQFLSKLDGFGVARIPSLGQRFDPARHEAVTTVAVADPDEDGTIVGVVSEGYAIGDEVLRPAAVAVGKCGEGS